MPAVPDWNVAMVLTNPATGSLQLNTQLSDRIYLLDKQGCSFDIEVRSTKDNVPQSDGSILHHRFLTGAEMQLTIQLWQSTDQVACDDLLADMVDEVTAAFRSLLNAGDNEGRLAWAVDGKNERMLDDTRLLVYPKYQETDGPGIIVVTIDSQYPYAQDLTQVLTPLADGVPVLIDNSGSAEYFPVFQVNRLNGVPGSGSVSTFTLENLTTGDVFEYDAGQIGAGPIPASHYAEIDTFRNTIYEDGNGADLASGIVETTSDYWRFLVGEQTIQITGCDADVLWAPAWG